MGFLQKYPLHNVKFKGKTASADEPAVKEFLPQVAKLIADTGYTPDQVWNVGKTGLFWKKTPSRTYVA